MGKLSVYFFKFQLLFYQLISHSISLHSVLSVLQCDITCCSVNSSKTCKLLFQDILSKTNIPFSLIQFEYSQRSFMRPTYNTHTTFITCNKCIFNPNMHGFVCGFYCLSLLLPISIYILFCQFLLCINHVSAFKIMQDANCRTSRKHL